MIRIAISIVAAALLWSASAAAASFPTQTTELGFSAASLSLPGEWASSTELTLALNLTAEPGTKVDAPTLHPSQLSLPGEIVDDLLAPSAPKTPVSPAPHCPSK